MTKDYAGSILLSLRQIIRSIDKHNKQLSSSRNLTVPQLICLRQLFVEGPRPMGRLANEVFLSKATITGIVDRLEKKGLVKRERTDMDRRKVTICLTPEGTALAEAMPWPLQERFAESLSSLRDEDIELIDHSLKKLLDMMEAPDLEVWPFGGEDAVPEGARIITPGEEEHNGGP